MLERSYLQEVVSEEHAGVQWLIDRLNIYHQQEKQVLDTELQALDEDPLQKQIDSCIAKRAALHGSIVSIGKTCFAIFARTSSNSNGFATKSSAPATFTVSSTLG